MSLADQQWCPTSVQVTVLQARGLRIKGKSGTNDAYAVMQVGKEKYQTSVAEKSVAPVWKEEAAFDLPQGAGGGGGERGTLHVHVLHRALVGPDKHLGQAVINLLQLSEDKTRNKTEWFKLLDKTGKADKDRGEVLLDIQFMRNNMTSSMFDLTGAGKSRSRLGKLKDKVSGKRKDSYTVSVVGQSFTQVMSDSEDDLNGDEEAPAGKYEKKKKLKVKSLFSPKSNLQKNMSQSMSVLPGKNSLSSSQSSGLNVDPSDGKKKFKFKIHKRSGSESKESKHGSVEQSNVCINGSHVYCEEPQSRASRIGSNFSLASSGHGSMEDVPESPPSTDSLMAVKQSSPWTVEEEDTAEADIVTEDDDEVRKQEEERIRMEKEEEEGRQKEEEEEKLRQEEEQEERKRMEEEEKLRKEEEERIQREEEERRIEEKRRLEEEERIRKEEERRQEEEERARKEKEEHVRLLEEKRKMEEQERRRIEEEEGRIRKEEERKKEEEERARKEKEEYERLAEENRKLEEEKRQKEEEERIRKEEERAQEERRRLEEQKRIEEEKIRKEEEDRKQREEERRRKEEEEIMRRQEEEWEKRRLEEQERKQREEEERIRKEEERARKEKEEYERLAEENRKLEEEKRQKEEEERAQEERRRLEEQRRIEEEKIRKEEEERKQREEERRRKEEEEIMRRQEEEERARKEKEEYERLLAEKERERIEAEDRIRREEEERIRMEEEKKKKEQEAERLRKEEEEREEKRRLEEQERRRIEEEQKRQREEEDEEERARKEKEEHERLAEEKRRLEEQERIRKQEEEERAKKEREEMERLAEEKRRVEEEERIKKEYEEGIRREKKAEREKKEEEARKLKIKKVTYTEKQKKNEKKTQDGNKTAKVVSTNPFDEDVDEGCLSAVSSVESEIVPADKSAQREKRQAPKPPGRNQAESRREQDVSARNQGQINKQSNDKDVKTASVTPQRSVKAISTLSQSQTDTKTTQSSMQSSTAKGATSANKQGKRPAPSRPRSVEEEEPSPDPKTASSSDGDVSQTKQNPIVQGLNPFEDEDENKDTATCGNTGSVQWPPLASKAADNDAKLKLSKPRAPPLPGQNAASTSSSTLTQQNTDGGHVTEETSVDVSEKCDPLQVTSVRAQSAGEEAEVTKEVPPATSRRLQPVKPLNSLEQQSDSVVQGNETQKKTMVNDAGLKGPYSQLTREELISLVLKQEKQLSDRDKKISELEEYIDNLLLRVMEEQPSILMSLSSVKKAV